MNWLRTKRHPERFQGTLNKNNYFEGWYFKIVSEDENHIYAIIPGIMLNKKEQSSHAFIQILDGIDVKYHFLKYPLESFTYEKIKFSVKVDDNFFSYDGLKLNIQNEKISIKGEIKISNQVPIPKKFLRPGIMGPFTYFPFMQTYHGIVSMNHQIDGSLVINEKEIDFSRGKGYIEKDWGRSFPKHWVWMQSNNFSVPNRSFMFSIAKVPYLGFNFNGFILSLWDRGEFFIMGTYTGAKVSEIDIGEHVASFTVENKNYLIEIQAKKAILEENRSDSAIMMTPQKGTMISKCIESMKSTLEIKIWKKHKRSDNELLFSDIGKASGLEIMGKSGDF